MNDEAEHNQAMLERAQMLMDALQRGIAGVATDDDWDVIHFECGVSRNRYLETQN
jgi:hypothetical protein